MKKNIILIILLLFIFINKAQAEEEPLKLLGFSYNEILLSEEKYIVIGNVGKDFQSIKYNADNYCSNKFGDNYKSKSIQISTNVAYAYCLMIDELDQFNLTNFERRCFHRFDLSLDIMFDRDCKNITRDFESIITELKKYRESTNILSSISFIYEILNEDLSKKISNFEAKVLLSKQTRELKQTMAILENPLNEQVDVIKQELLLKKKLATLENPLNEQIDTFIVNRNIKMCELYEFVKGSELYFECILALLNNQKKKVI